MADRPREIAPAPRLSPAGKTAVGLSLAVALLFCAVIIAGLGTHAARVSADSVKNRHLPFMETALTLESHVYDAIFHSSMFGLSGNMTSYSGARIRFAAIRETIDRLSKQALNVPEGHALSRDLEVLRDLARRLDMTVEKKRTLNDDLAAEQAKLRKTADAMGEILLGLQAVTAAASTGKDAEKTLDDKARLLVLNGFSLAVAEITGQALAAGTAGNAEGIAKTQAYFTERWNQAREACGVAAALSLAGGKTETGNPAEAMDHLADSFAALLNAIRFNLEETGRVAEEQTSVTSSLLSLTRGIAAVVRAGMAEAAVKTDTALRGATATLFACALLACVIAIGAAFVFVRSRQ